MNCLDAASPIPEPGWAFRIHTLCTSDTAPPYLTGMWHYGGQQPADPDCALWLMFSEHADCLDLVVFADHEQIPDTFISIARYTNLPPGTWTSAVAPAIAAHPYVTCEHVGAPRAQRHRAARAARAARAILACLIAHH